MNKLEDGVARERAERRLANIASFAGLSDEELRNNLCEGSDLLSELRQEWDSGNRDLDSKYEQNFSESIGDMTWELARRRGKDIPLEQDLEGLEDLPYDFVEWTEWLISRETGRFEDRRIESRKPLSDQDLLRVLKRNREYLAELREKSGRVDITTVDLQKQVADTLERIKGFEEEAGRRGLSINSEGSIKIK